MIKILVCLNKFVEEDLFASPILSLMFYQNLKRCCIRTIGFIANQEEFNARSLTRFFNDPPSLQYVE